MRKLIPVCLLGLVFLLPTAVRAQLTFTTNNGAITITGYAGSPTTLTIPGTTNGYNVVSIGDSAFFNQTSLTSVTIPGGITSLGNSAFAGCGFTSLPGLGSIRIFGTNVFADNLRLTNNITLNLNNTVTNLPGGMFSGCANLTSINLPANVTAIGNSFFAGCGFINLPGLGNIKTFGADIFADNLRLTNNLTLILNGAATNLPDGMFSGCANLTGITLPSNITGIGSSFFAGCGFINLPGLNNIKTFGADVFADNLRLTNNLTLNLNNVVTNLPDGMFSDCANLTGITLPFNVTGLGSSVFAGCGFTSLPSLSNIKTFGADVFAGDLRLTNLTISLNSTVTNLPDGMFSGCVNLTNIPSMSGTINGLGNSAFAGCGFTSLPGLGNIKTFGADVFADNLCLTNLSITLNNAVTNLPDGMFSGCANLISVPSMSSSITGFGNSVFAGCGFTSLPSLTNIKTFGADVFADNLRLTNLTIVLNSIVTNLPDGMFSGCANLASIPSMPANVTGLGNSVFAGCGFIGLPSLSNIKTLGTNVFADNLRLTNLTLSVNSAVTNLPDGMFSGCANLININLPFNVTGLGDSVFAGCAFTSLPSLNNIKTFGADVFAGDLHLTNLTLTLNSAVTNLPDGMFSGCANLISVSLPFNVTGLGNSVFTGCAFTSLPGLSNIRTLGTNVFADCLGLTNVSSFNLNSAATNLPDGMFSGCANLISINLPFSVTGLGNSVFAGCAFTSLPGLNNIKTFGADVFAGDLRLTNLTINLNSAVTNLPDGMFSGCANLATISSMSGTITGLGNSVFTGCGLTTFTISSNIKSLGTNVFSYCTNLSSVFINGGITNIPDDTFYGCTKLSSVSLPNSVTSIGIDAFAGCTSLTSITFSANVASFGDRAFQNCTSLQTLTFLGNAPMLGSSVFSGVAGNATDYYYYGTGGWDGINGSFGGLPVSEVNVPFTYTLSHGVVTVTGYTGPGSVLTIPASIAGYPVTGIGYGAFSSSSLTSVTIANNVTNIGGAAFAYCYSLTTVVIGDSVINLGDANDQYGVFGNCLALSSLVLGTNVTTIGNDVFVNCIDLTGITIPGRVTTIGDGAFAGSGLAGITIPNNVIKLGDANDQAGVFGYCTALTYVVISTNITSIGGYAFAGCANLSSITLPDGVASAGVFTIPDGITSIGPWAFYGCWNLSDMTIPGNVTNIGPYAFYDSFLAGVTIPNSVTSIGPWAFAYTKLTDVTIPNGVTSIGTNAFYHSALTSVTIPNGVANIGDWAFADNGLTGVTIPGSVTNIGVNAFYFCAHLNGLTFLGNAPTLGDSALSGIAGGATVYYYYGTGGWGATYGGVPTVELAPTPQIAVGVSTQANSFRFAIVGTNGMPFIVQASTDLVNWQPILTNTVSATPFNFSDPQWTNYPGRYYRLSSQ